MIISTHFEVEAAAEKLYQLEVFFKENALAQALKSKYDLSFEMELLDKYVLITLKPIKTTNLKNKMLYLLSSQYPKIFFVDAVSIGDNPTRTEKEMTLHANADFIKKIPVEKYREKENRLYMFDTAWSGFLLLAILGGLFVFWVKRQIGKIKTLEKTVEMHHDKIEGEMVHMRDEYV